MTAAQELLTRVLELPENDRGMIARRILLSLESDDETVSHEEWKTAWAEEIQRRRDAIQNGTAKLSTWPEVKSRLMSEFHSGASNESEDP